MHRDDMKPRTETSLFESLPLETQLVLKRAASHGKVQCTSETLVRVGRDWLMVPSKRGPRQVVVRETVAFRI